MIMPLLICLEWWRRRFKLSDSIKVFIFVAGCLWLCLGVTVLDLVNKHNPHMKSYRNRCFCFRKDCVHLCMFGCQLLFLRIVKCLLVCQRLYFLSLFRFVFWSILSLSRVPLDVCALWLSNTRVQAFQTLWRISIGFLLFRVWIPCRIITLYTAEVGNATVFKYLYFLSYFATIWSIQYSTFHKYILLLSFTFNTQVH